MLKKIILDYYEKGGLEDGIYAKRFYKYKLKDYKFTYLGENLLLHPYKSMYWEKYKILFLSDLHIGKAAHFRKSGIPIPENIHALDFERIELLLNRYKPKRIIFLGDLFHSSFNNSWSIFKDFCTRKIDFIPELVIGNHDIMDDDHYGFLKTYHDRLVLDPFILSHKPLPADELKGYYNLCGHLHPSVKISGPARQSLRVECFYFGKNHGILPAFGNFTGNSKMPRRKKTDTIFAVTDQKIIRLY